MPKVKKIPVLREKKVRRRSNAKLLLLLFVFFIMIFIFLFFNSSFSRIESIEINGNVFLTDEEIEKVTQIQREEQFFAFSSYQIEQRVQEIQLIETVEVIKKFPGQVIINVKEYDEVAYKISEEGSIQAVLANGSSVHLINHPIVDKPVLTNWDPTDSVFVSLSQVLSTIPQPLLNDISEIKPDPSASYPDKIKLYTRSFFEITTTVSYLTDKVNYIDEIIFDLQKRGINSGEIIMLEADSHIPFNLGKVD